MIFFGVSMNVGLYQKSNAIAETHDITKKKVAENVRKTLMEILLGQRCATKLFP